MKLNHAPRVSSSVRTLCFAKSLVATLGVATLLIGCAPERNERARLRVLGEDSSNLQAMESLQASAPFMGAEIEFRKHAFDDAMTKANLDFAQRTGRYDIVLQYNFSLSSYVRNDFVYTLAELKRLARGVPAELFTRLEADLFPNVWKEVGWYYDRENGSREIPISYPFAGNTMLLVTNTKMFEDPRWRERHRREFGRELEAPKSWEDFGRLARFFTNPQEGTYGVCLQGQQGGWLYYEWCNFLFGMGGRVMSKERGWQGTRETSVEVDNSAAIKAAEFYVSLRPYNAGDFLAVGAPEQVEILLRGQTAMAIVWSDYLTRLVQESGLRGVEFGYHPIPGGRSMIAGGAFYVNRRTKAPQEAAAYVLHILSPENQAKLIVKGLCSPVRSAYDQSIVREVPYAEALRQSLEQGVYMLEAGPDADAIQAVLTEALQQLWLGTGTAETRLREARKQIDQRRAAIWNAIAPK